MPAGKGKFKVAERRPATMAVHAGRLEQPVNPGSSPPLFQASSYEFSDLDEVNAIYAGERKGAIYGRYGGPNARQFEAAMAELELAEAAAGAAAGMSAIDAALRVALGRSDGGLIVTRELYGGTFALLENDYRLGGTAPTYVDQGDLSAVERALAAASGGVLYAEALTNPLVHVADLTALAGLAHAHGALFLVDATFATPLLCRPLEFGADLVIHSVGKYLGGHGDVGAGVVCGPREIIEDIRAWLVRHGATMPHFEAWLALRGLRTLGARMERHARNAVIVAQALAEHPSVRAVHHPALREAERAFLDRYYPSGASGMLAFEIEGGAAAVARFLKALDTIAIVHSLGEVATTISYPAVASHRMLTAGQREALGIGDGLLRMSIGIEDPADILADLARGFAALEA